MMTVEKFRELALSLPDASEVPHHDKTAFRVKRIFATLDEAKRQATLKLSEVDQSVFCDVDRSAIYPVPNKWGKQGWTIFEIENVQEDVLWDALSKAHKEVS